MCKSPIPVQVHAERLLPMIEPFFHWKESFQQVTVCLCDDHKQSHEFHFFGDYV